MAVQVVWGVGGRVVLEFTFRIAARSVTALIIGARLTVAGAGTSATNRAESVAFLKRQNQRDEMNRDGQDWRLIRTFFLLLVLRKSGGYEEGSGSR
jgi:hypothetical protein